MTERVISQGDVQCDSCETIVAEDQVVHCAACGKVGCVICTIEVASGERVCMLDGAADPDCEKKELESYLNNRRKEYEKSVELLDSHATELKSKLYMDYDVDVTKVSKRLDVLNGGPMAERVAGAKMILDALLKTARVADGRRTTITAGTLSTLLELVTDLAKTVR